jgi:hypothetical protein
MRATRHEAGRPSLAFSSSCRSNRFDATGQLPALMVLTAYLTALAKSQNLFF